MTLLLSATPEDGEQGEVLDLAPGHRLKKHRHLQGEGQTGH